MSVDTQPIFIHSLFRSGSTYIFNVFRRSPSGYWCYQEPLNEFLLCAANSPDELLNNTSFLSSYLRHPELDKPYFFEFNHLASEVGHLFHKKFCYDQYFLSETDDIADLKAYISMLIQGAKGRPVFQFCRSTGRIKSLKAEYGGTHIYLWRNPWDQWWSYKLDSCFDRSNLLIVNAPTATAFIAKVRDELGINGFHSSDIQKEYDYFNRNRLDASGSYMLFYALWCHAMLEARPSCDILVNIDRLSTNTSYRTEILKKLSDIEIKGLDLSDCLTPIGSYENSDIDFFQSIEEHVHGLLLTNGYRQAQLDEMLALRNEYTISANEQADVMAQTLARDALRARELARRNETGLALEMQKAESLAAQLSQGNEQNAHLQAHAQWLQNEWDAAKVKIDELNHSSHHWWTVADGLNQENKTLNEQADVMAQTLARDALRARDLARRNETGLALEMQKAESLAAQLSQGNEQNAHLQAHAQWLQNEWDAAKVKIDELNHSSHHWWTVADGLNQENKTLYISRSWRITKPLRLLSLGVSKLFKALLYIPKGIWWVIKWLILTLLLIPKAIWWLFKSPFKLMLSVFISYAIKRPAIKQHFFAWLGKYPKMHKHTLQFARVRGINLDVITTTIITTQQPQITETQKFTMPVFEETNTDLTSLSPRARHIYLDLKGAMDRNNKENS